MNLSRLKGSLCAISLCLWVSGCIYEPPQALSDPDTSPDEECSPEALVTCGADGDLYWVDSCGRRGEKERECPPELPCLAGPPAQCAAPLTEPCLTLALIEGEGEPDRLNFGPTMTGTTRRSRLALESCGDEALTISELELQGHESFSFSAASLPFTIEPGAREPIELSFSPQVAGEWSGSLLIKSDDRGQPLSEVRLTGLGIIDPCPKPEVTQLDFDLEPLEVVTLDASPSLGSDGTVEGLSYEWQVISRPQGSTAQPVEAFFNPNAPDQGGTADDPRTPEALFFVDLVGDYTFALVLTDPTGYSAPSESCPDERRVELRARTQDAIRIELTWRTPSDPNELDTDGTDLDLHLQHPRATGWRDSDYVCFYDNGNPSWGPPGPEGDASLDLDDVNGAGPENINIDTAEDTQALGREYLIGVHYFSDNGFGPSEALIRVYLSGELEVSYERSLERSDHFWVPAKIHWTPARQWAEEVDDYFQTIP